MRRHIGATCSCDCVLQKQVHWVPEIPREIAAAGSCYYVPVKQVYWVLVWPEMPGEIAAGGSRVRGIRKANLNCGAQR